MRKDPTEFRNRFAMYKDGKKPYEAGRPVDDERYVEFAELQANQWANEVNGPYNNEYRDNEITNEIMLNILSDNTYDYKNYVKDNVIIPVKFLTTAGGAHFSDKYKTVYHPTFSNQSLYSGLKSLYNPRGTEGGSWSKSGDVYYPSKSQIDNSDFNYNKTREYLNYAEKNPVKIQMPKYDTGTGDRDYLPLYEYDIEVTPQGVSAQKHKRITNEQDWLKYWGDKGATSVSRSMHEQAPGYAAAITAPADLITGVAALPEAIMELGSLAKGIYAAANTINPRIGRWSYRIPTNNKMAYRIMSNAEKNWLLEGNPLASAKANSAAHEAEMAAVQTSRRNSAQRFTLMKSGAEHGGRKQFAKGKPWGGTTVTHGEKQYLAIPGDGLNWISGRHYAGPQGHGRGVGSLDFSEVPFGAHIDLATDAETGLSTVNPSLLQGSRIYEPFDLFGRQFGYKMKPLTR